ncbi:MAG: nuclear transport factor 2 family protein [Chloroflexi bacterium]|nr:nuclear transport factor 2 family protein [Chloroflexota bacterium]
MEDRDEIMALETRLLDAWGSPGSHEVRDLFAEEFGFWSLTGERWDRDAFLRIMASSPREGETRVETSTVRVFGGTAVYSARITDVIPGPEGTTEMRTCVTDVFARIGDRWQMVASHESIIADG